MSAPSTALPAEVAEVMTVTTVDWERSTGVDGYGQQSYAAPVQIDCWCEPAGLMGGVEALRATLGHTAEFADTEPQLELYFDADDSRVQAFSMDDRFTPGQIAGAGQKLKPRRISTLNAPPFNNQAPWLCVVGL